MNEKILKAAQRETAFEQIDAIFRYICNKPKWQIASVFLLAIIAIESGVNMFSYLVTQKEQSKTVLVERGKSQFWRASYFANINNFDAMNISLNKIAKNPLFKNINYQNELLKQAEQINNQMLIDGIVARQILIEKPEAMKAFDRMIEAQNRDPEAWSNYLKENETQKNQVLRK